MELQQRVEQEILKTPTGELRNLLCDLNIVLEHSKNVILLTKEDLLDRFKEISPEYISLDMFKRESVSMEDYRRAYYIVYVVGDYANVLKSRHR